MSTIPPGQPISVKSPVNSFVQFNEAAAPANCCDTDNDFCLPVVKDDDCYFQVILTFQSVASADHAMATNTYELAIFMGLGNIGTSVPLHNYTATDGLLFVQNRTGKREITLTWSNILYDIHGNPMFDMHAYINCEDCFQLGFRIHWTAQTSDPQWLYMSNCFIKKCDSCFTAVIEYGNDEDFADFRYCNVPGFVNRVRLPFHFTQPQLPDNDASYTMSNGKIRILKSVSQKEFQALTDHLPEIMHERLKTAISSDYKKYEGDVYVGEFAKSSPYQIEWTDNICKAPANFKALASPFAIRNNNCQDCQAVDLSCEPLTGLQWSVEVNEADGEQTFTFTWDPPAADVTSVTIQYKITGDPTWIDDIGSANGPRSITVFTIAPYDFRFITTGDCQAFISNYLPAIGEDPGMSHCYKVEGLSIEDPGDTSAIANWSPQMPLPALGYDWEVRYSTVPYDLILSGHYDGTGGPFLLLSPLPGPGDYRFQIKDHCSEHIYSDLAVIDFAT